MANDFRPYQVSLSRLLDVNRVKTIFYWYLFWSSGSKAVAMALLLLTLYKRIDEQPEGQK
ncbi:hypothetical protein V6Z11_A10G205500 [Gossypium hirsutum]